ncbi:MAG TPA: hypothetical protein PLX13_13710 [Saprospiraceae bacterium]|nr:hypothetical protein [Saprospiraceae bacterium]
MSVKKYLLSICLLISFSAFAQKGEKLPVIKAHSLKVDIRDGEELKKDYWTITPELNPDEYTSPSLGKRVVFYTDIDSISVTLGETTIFDFIILVDGKKKAVTRIRYKPSNLTVLKNAANWNISDARSLPEFTYLDSSDERLRALRTGFNLDSIAGKGNEVSRILEMLHWIHNLIPHDGQHDNPEVRNAMSMIRQCKAEHRGLNCRGLGTVLNECYLAMGFKSRFLTCLPKDSLDTECHVINMVYSNDLKKWIWVDPTHDSYVMNEKGELLGPAEVRERLIDGRPLILNPTANWNHQQSSLIEDYIYDYMAKNLYRFSCPLASTYDTETATTDKSVTYIELVPPDYYHQQSGRTETMIRNGKIRMIEYQTNNPDVFFAMPR